MTLKTATNAVSRRKRRQISCSAFFFFLFFFSPDVNRVNPQKREAWKPPFFFQSRKEERKSHLSSLQRSKQKPSSSLPFSLSLPFSPTSPKRGPQLLPPIRSPQAKEAKNGFPPFPPPPPPPTLPLPLPPNLSPFHCWEWRHKKEDGEGRQEWFFFRRWKRDCLADKSDVFFRRGVRVKVAASALVFLPQRRVCVFCTHSNPFFCLTPPFLLMSPARKQCPQGTREEKCSSE